MNEDEVFFNYFIPQAAPFKKKKLTLSLIIFNPKIQIADLVSSRPPLPYLTYSQAAIRGKASHIGLEACTNALSSGTIL